MGGSHGSVHSQGGSRDDSPRAASGSHSSEGGSGRIPFVNYSMQPPNMQISLSKSGDTLNSGKSSLPPGPSPSFQGPPKMQQQQQPSLQQRPADASVLLGLEELERQQAEVEKRRAHEAEMAAR